jgi:predicted SAM-dependent methyltransferase
MFGAEYSIKKWFDRNDYYYTTADLFNRSADIKADIQNTPFGDETWDLIICNHVLEHVPNYKDALTELRRILKINGQLELTVPTDRSFETVYEDATITSKEERIKAYGQSDHVRIFGNDFEKILLELGFSVEVIDGNELPAEIVGIIGPANYDDNRVYICKKIKNI